MTEAGEQRLTADGAAPEAAAGQTPEAAEGKEQDLTLEEAFARLDGLVERLETRGIPLEESFQIYKEGMELLKECSARIDTVEKKMLQINSDGEISEF